VFVVARRVGTKPCEYGGIGARPVVKKAAMIVDLEPKAE
jgi:hypothetical protein